MESGEVIITRPEYQRRLRWTNVQKSKLIESLLLNIPIPPVYLYESSAARYEVMDGQQRLNAIQEFLAGEFSLVSLTELAPLNGLRYSKCPPRIKRALDRATVSATVLLMESEALDSRARLSITEIKRVIFDRLNTGGTKLNAQEIRNALNPGHFNSAIVKISQHRNFTTAFDIPPYNEELPDYFNESPLRKRNSLYATMGDCQLVLRYFALKDENNIRGSMRSILDRAMEKRLSADQAAAAIEDYCSRFDFLFDLFDGEPFRLPPDDKGKIRVSAALYDSSMIAIDNLWSRRNEIIQDKLNVMQRLSIALSNSESLAMLTGQANTAQAIKDRIALVKKIFVPDLS